jgi:hypothetical protein
MPARHDDPGSRGTTRQGWPARLAAWPGRWASALLAVLILFEEWGWDALHRAAARLARWPPWARLEARITHLTPYPALALFGLPALSLLPVKLLALMLIGQSRPVLGVLVIVLAKVLGTAVVARLYALTQPALMQLAWFARLHTRWVVWKDALLLRVRASLPWRWARRLRSAARRRWRQWQG